MNFIEILKQEFEREVKTTRKFLAIVPDDKFDWKPHEKSMTIKSLATHIAELPTWIPLTLDTDGLDFASSSYEPKQLSTTKELVDYYEEAVLQGRKGLENTTEAQLM